MPRETDGRWETRFGQFVNDYGAEELAERVKQTPASVYHWVGGRAFPRPDTANQIVGIARDEWQPSDGRPLTLEDIYRPTDSPMMIDRLESAGFFSTPKGDPTDACR